MVTDPQASAEDPILGELLLRSAGSCISILSFFVFVSLKKFELIFYHERASSIAPPPAPLGATSHERSGGSEDYSDSRCGGALGISHLIF